MAAAKIIVVEKNEGEKIAYDVSTTKIIFGDDDLMVNIKNRERDEEVTLDICKDTQDGLTDIEDLKKQEKEDIKAMEDELCLLTYAVLACLKGLKEQGCNGPVTEAIGKIEKHINQKAHGQET